MSDDLISRQKAFEYFVALWECIGTIMDRDEWEDACITTANEIPSAQPERKTGRWIPCPQNASWLYVYKCSECGGYLQISDVDGIGYKANYCSYCGAKMEGR